jgi:hypothetical protein
MTITTHSHRTAPLRARRPWLTIVLAGSALALALSGCTSAGTTDGGSNSHGGASGQPSTEAEFSAARDAYDLKLAECFRDHGLDVKDPLPGKGITEDTPEIREAYPACAEEIGDPPTNAGMKISPEDLEKLLERAKCLREKGYEIQEPTADDPGFIGAEVTDEDFEACEV